MGSPWCLVPGSAQHRLSGCADGSVVLTPRMKVSEHTQRGGVPDRWLKKGSESSLHLLSTFIGGRGGLGRGGTMNLVRECGVFSQAWPQLEQLVGEGQRPEPKPKSGSEKYLHKGLGTPSCHKEGLCLQQAFPHVSLEASFI